ncbi:MAG: ABC transporter substrate-binding protein [Litorilinea sp.]
MSVNTMNRRQLLKTFGAGVGMLTLAACAAPLAPAAPSASEAATGASTEPQTITLWSSFSGVNGTAENTLVERFNEQMDGDVVVDYQFQGSYEETAAKVTAALQANTAPEIALLSDVWWFKFYLSQHLLPLDSLMEAQNVDLADYHDSLINEGVRQGQHYWMPFARSTPLFYYNKEKWEAAGLPDRGPATWDEFTEWAELLVERDGDEVTTSAFAHPDGASYIAWLFQGVVWQFGGAYSDADFTMRMTDEETIAAGQFYHDTVHNFQWAVPSSDLGVDFINGFTAAAMMSTGSLGGINANAEFEFGTAFLPEKDGFGCCTGGAGLSVLSNAPEDKHTACMQYIEFASNPEQTTFWSQATGYMPVRKSAQERPEMLAYFEEFPQFKTATDQLALTRAQDAARVFVPNGDQIIGRGLERITVQSDAVAGAFADVQRILEEEAQPVVEQLHAIEA